MMIFRSIIMIVRVYLWKFIHFTWDLRLIGITHKNQVWLDLHQIKLKPILSTRKPTIGQPATEMKYTRLLTN